MSASAPLLLSRSIGPYDRNPDDEFILHGRSSSYWERPGYLTNSMMTGTTSRLSQHDLYDADNYRDTRLREKKYARTMTDLANNLEYMSGQVNDTLTKGVTFKEDDKDRMLVKVRKPILASDFKKPLKNETLRSDLDEDELLDLYEKQVGEIDSLSGRPVSPRDSQWFVNPNHRDTSCEAPTLQSIGKTYRDGRKSRKDYSDKDAIAFSNFPVTLGSSYELCALDFPDTEHMNKTAPPSMRGTRSKSASQIRRSQMMSTRDKFDPKRNIDELYLTTDMAPTIGSSEVYLTSPHQIILGKLRLERLRLEEAKLLELKRLEELERIRGPRSKWYESKGPDFHYESNKNTQLIQTESRFQDMLDYREDLLRASYNNLKKYSRQLSLA